MRFSLRFALPTSACLLIVVACQQHAVVRSAEAVPIPPAAAEKPVTLPGLHNVVTYAPGVVSGGQPEGEEGLETLHAMGFKTIVSVDGATPDVEGAEKLGMRYVHLPISYDTVSPERQRALAQVLSSLPGPVYMHCHHGKHRSAAALGSALVLTGTLTPDQACARMSVSGTSKDYKGLWKAVKEGHPVDASQLKADPASFPKVTVVSGMVESMAEIDLVFDLVKQTKEASWKPPADHPDLVPTKETARLHSIFANLKNDADSVKLPAEYQAMLQKSIDLTQKLDAAVKGSDAAKASELFDAIGKACKECHKGYRDNN